MRTIILLMSVIFPGFIKLFIYRRIIGWKIGKNVKIGFSFIDVDTLDIEDNVRISHFNIIRTIRNLKIRNSSIIKNFNQFNGGRQGHPDKWKSELAIGREVMIMSHHFIDACGEVIINDRAILAGRNIHIWSHTLTYLAEDGPSLVPTRVEIGEDAYVGASSTLLGCHVPQKAIVGAGSLVNRSFADVKNCVLLAGNPARIKKEYLS